MKKSYRKTMVHETPSSVVSDYLLAFLPAAILNLTADLPPVDREVLAYLISYLISSQYQKMADHEPCFDCKCFLCYNNYWVQWDSSPNRQLIHDIIDAYEETSGESLKEEEMQSCVLNESEEDFCFVEEMEWVVVNREEAFEEAGSVSRGGSRKESTVVAEEYFFKDEILMIDNFALPERVQ